jgi:glycosyltransferase involved in cell wall biosynthesis
VVGDGAAPGRQVSGGHAPATPPDVSLVVPLKDERPSLPVLVEQIRNALDGSDVVGTWDLVLVDDGSTDGSWDEVCALAREDARVRGLRLRTNMGKSAALSAGIAATDGHVVVTLDADLQDDPAEIPALLRDLAAGADLVSGYKRDRKDPLSKRLPSKLFNRVTSLVTGLRLNDHNCGLKAGRREVFEGIPLYGELHRYVAATAHAGGWVVTERAVRHRPRLHGRSKFGLERYTRGALDLLTVVMLTRFGRRPGHLFGGFGVAFLLLGLLTLLYLSAVWLFTDSAIGDRPLLLLGVLLMVLGVQLVSTGMLAELHVHRSTADDDPTRHVVETVGASPDLGRADRPGRRA